MIEKGTEEERFLRELHLENNTFDDIGELRRVESRGVEQGDGGRSCWIDDEDVRVVLVQIQDGRISDWRGEVKDWSIGDREGGTSSDRIDQRALVNGN